MGKSKSILISAVLALSVSSVWGDFVRVDDKEIVLDTNLSLIWQDNVDAKTVTKDWYSAREYCSELSFAGYDDWHMPILTDLQSIVDTTNSPMIKTPFKNRVADNYWSSTTFAYNASAAWLVSFLNGNTYYKYKTDSLYVRCVRGGQYFDSLTLDNLATIKDYFTKNILIEDFPVKSELETQTAFDTRVTTYNTNLAERVSYYEVTLNAKFLMKAYDANTQKITLSFGENIVTLNDVAEGTYPLSLADAQIAYKKDAVGTFSTTFRFRFDYKNNRILFAIKTIALATAENNETNTTEPVIPLDEYTRNYCKLNPAQCGINLNGTVVGFTQDDIDHAVQEATKFDTTLLDNTQLGWSMLGANSNLNDMSIFDNVKIVWLYKDNKWNVYTNDTNLKELVSKNSYLGKISTINKNEGFWIFK